MHDPVALNLLYIQTLAEIEQSWIVLSKKTKDQLDALCQRSKRKEVIIFQFLWFLNNSYPLIFIFLYIIYKNHMPTIHLQLFIALGLGLLNVIFTGLTHNGLLWVQCVGLRQNVELVQIGQFVFFFLFSFSKCSDWNMISFLIDLLASQWVGFLLFCYLIKFCIF